MTTNKQLREPVARVKTVGGYPDESEHVVEWLCKHKDMKDGDYLYLVQQPALGMSGLTEALRQYQHNDGCGLVFGYDKLLVDQYVARLVEALDLALEYWRDRQQRYKNRRPKWVIAAESALAAFRKGGERQWLK